MNIDYKKIGMKCGLEIHQQLATQKKLFCGCSAALSDKQPVFEIKRRLRIVSGEMGEIDQAAAFESGRSRTFRYRVYPNETCDVELDEEPPHSVNVEALETALQVALMLNCEIPDEIHVMRKTVLDGSNTSGFQRTAVVGLNGCMKTHSGDVGIANVCLEEDSAQIIEFGKDFAVYGLNRLGIPLIEIGTSPDICDPEQAREIAESIGMILRSTGKARRILGAIRQDLNVSIEGGARTEIKGVQELGMIPGLIECEAKRQMEFVEKKMPVTKDVRKALPDGSSSFLRPMPGEARMYPETDCLPIKITKEMINCIKLPETIPEKQARFEKMLPKEMASQIVRSDYCELFEEFSRKFAGIRVLIADVFLSVLKDMKRKNLDVSRISREDFELLFIMADNKKISKDSMPHILERIAYGKGVEEAAKGYEFIPDSELEEIVKSAVEHNKDKNKSQLMGMLMKDLRGRVDGKAVMEKLDKFLH